jgi:hypothetical protein
MTVRGTSRYDKQPSVVVPGPHRVWKGPEGWQQVDRHASDGGKRAPLVAVDTYPGVDLAELAAEIRAALPHYAVINVEDAAAIDAAGQARAEAVCRYGHRGLR